MHPLAEVNLTTDQFARLRDFIYQKNGLFFDDTKVYFINKRVERRMRHLHVETAEEYIFQLRFSDPAGSEMQVLTNLITTHETYMFREYEQLEAFSNFCLPEVMAARLKNGKRQIRIWSAGCASGDEAYTLAIILLEVVNQLETWQIEVLATDIDDSMLDTARRAVYSERAIKYVPKEYAQRHLIPEPIGWRIHPDTAKLVQFQQMNLHDRIAIRAMHNFDFIFCRNVLIYFDDVSRKTAIDHFYNSLNPGGYIFLGHSESIGRISTAFKLIRQGEFLVYQKP